MTRMHASGRTLHAAMYRTVHRPAGSAAFFSPQLAHEIEKAGATIINTGIGWHEARVPTIATMVPRCVIMSGQGHGVRRAPESMLTLGCAESSSFPPLSHSPPSLARSAAYSWVTQRMKEHVTVPLVAVNRINTPEIAERYRRRETAPGRTGAAPRHPATSPIQPHEYLAPDSRPTRSILEEGHCDMVSMARPLLADPHFVKKARPLAGAPAAPPFRPYAGAPVRPPPEIHS